MIIMTDREFYLMVSRDMDVKSLDGCKAAHHAHTAQDAVNDVYSAKTTLSDDFSERS